MALGLFVLAHLAHWAAGDVPLLGAWQDPERLLLGYEQWDALWITEVARNGYLDDGSVPATAAVFPLLPVAIHLVTELGVGVRTAGVGIALVAGTTVAILWDRWLGVVAGLVEPARTVAWWALMAFPLAFFLYGPIYSDGIMLAATLGAFLLVAADRPVAAGLVAAVATAARPPGIAAVVGVLAVALVDAGVLGWRGWHASAAAGRRWRWPITTDLGSLRLRTLGPLLGVAGIVGYAGYLWWRFGEPLGFVESQRAHHEGATPLFDFSAVRGALEGWADISVGAVAIAASLVVAAAVGLWATRDRLRAPVRRWLVVVTLILVAVAGRWEDFLAHPGYRTTTLLQALACVAVVGSIPSVLRRFGLGYAIYVAVVVALPFLTNTGFQSAGRYLLAAFPVAAVWGERLAAQPRSVRTASLLVGGGAMAMLWVAFSFVYFIA